MSDIPQAPPAGRVHVGIGGWTYEPWRGGFYPKGLPRAQELHFASRQLTSIEVNGTYYSTFKPATFAQWRRETPAGFTFSLKANRFCTHRRELGAAGESIARFVASGIAELGDKLGPIVWQFMPTKRFEPADFAAFLKLLPREAGGIALRHALDVRHGSFVCDEYLALAHRHGCATVHTDSPDYPAIHDAGGPFAYLRLMRTDASIAAGYAAESLDRWAEGARVWCGAAQDGTPGRDVFCYFIAGAKERAPAAAAALIARLGPPPTSPF